MEIIWKRVAKGTLVTGWWEKTVWGWKKANIWQVGYNYSFKKLEGIISGQENIKEKNFRRECACSIPETIAVGIVGVG